MGQFLLRAASTGLALWVVTKVVSGIEFVGGDSTLQRVGIIFVVAVIFGVVNAFIKPIVQLISIPLYILTLGLIHIVINALMLWITSWITENTTHWGLYIDDFWWTAIWAAIVLSIVSWVLSVVCRTRSAPAASLEGMPELPEVEALADHLRRHAAGLTVGRVDVAALSVLKTFDPPITALHGPDGHRRQPVGQVPRPAGRRAAPDHASVQSGLAAMVGQAVGGAAAARRQEPHRITRPPWQAGRRARIST